MAYYISSGQVSSGIILNNDSMYISSGGTANSTTVNLYGNIYISSSGIANNTTVNSGTMYISSGGVANSTTVNNYGEMDISSGGVANNITVNSGGWMKISSGCTATDITALDGARLYITVASNTYIQGTYNGSAFEIKDAYISGYTVNSGGWMYISFGGAANSTKVNSGNMSISSGGIANNTTVYNGGFLWLQGTASNTVLSGNAYGYASMAIASGGSAYDTDVNYRGVLQIISSAKIDETKVNSGGSMAVSFGGVANNTTINSDGLIVVSSGGTANNLTLKIGGQLGGFSFNEEKIWSSYIGAETEISDNVTINGSGMDVADKGVIDNVVVNSVATMYVSSGGTANNIKVNSRGIMRISSGGTVNNMIAQSGARIHMTVAPYTYVQGKYNNSAFEMKDGKLSGYTVDSAGYVGVTFGGTATETIVNSFGALHISSLAVANDNIVNANGSMVISLGGVAHNTVVNSRGYLYIYSGTHKGNLQIANGAIVSAYKGGVIDFTVAERAANDGYLINDMSLILGTPTYTITVSANQESGIYKLAQGAGNFSSSISIGDGTTSFGSITVNGEDFVYNGTTYSLDQVDGNLTLTVSANAAPPPAAEPSVFIYSSGILTSSGTVINDATIVSGGNDSMYISSGGVANDTILSGGNVDINYGGMINNTSAKDGTILVLGGGIASKTQLGSMGCMWVSNGGRAVDTVLSDNAYFIVGSGGSVNSTTVKSGGHIDIAAGADATNITAENGAKITMQIASNTYVQGKSNGSAFVMQNASLSGFAISSDSEIEVLSGGVASDTTVKGWGWLHVESAGSAVKTFLNSDGRMAVSRSGYASDTVVSSGAILYLNECSVDKVTVSSGGSMRIESSVTARELNIIPGAEYEIYLDSNTDIQGQYNNSAFVMKNSLLEDFTIHSGGIIKLKDGVIGSNTVVNESGYLHISKGAVHKGTLILASEVIVADGGIIDFTVSERSVSDDYLLNDMSLITEKPTYTITVSDNQAVGTYKLAQKYYYDDDNFSIGSGSFYFYETITVNGEDVVWKDRIYSLDQVDGNLTLTVSANAAPPPAVEPSVFIYSSSTVTSSGTVIDGATIVNGGNNSMHISSGGVANNTVVNSKGEMFISNGGTANDTVINSAGALQILSGGYASRLIINSGVADAYVMDGGRVDDVTVSSGGRLYVSSGQAVNITDVKIKNGGKIDADVGNWGINISGTHEVYGDFCVKDNYASNFTAYGDDWFYINSGGVADSINAVALGRVIVRAGALASNTDIYNEGYLRVDSDGRAENTNIENGLLRINIGGTALNTYMNSGELQISSGAVHQGELQIANGAIVSASQGGVIDFTIADRTASDDYLINDLSLISGNPTYTITVSDNQTDGIYKLAQGAGSFSGSITIGNGTINYGSITVNGEDFVYNDITYSLDQVDGNLTLTVEKFNEDTTPPEKPQASANITTPTERNVTVTAVFSNDSVVREYSLDGENWLEYEKGVVFEQNGTVYFRGTDAAGNISEIAVYNVENIELRDLTLSVYGNPAKWTNNDVSLTAISNRQAQIQYSFDGQKWLDGKSVVLTENKTVYFRAVDNFGNTAEKTVYVTKIDKVAPDTPLVSADVTENTNSAVTVTAVFSSDSVVKEYSLDGENWLEYERGVVFDENGTVYFRGTDAAGNISETAVYNVNNIDKEGSILSVSGNPTEWTNKDVVLTAFASDGVIEYFDGQKWVANNSLTVAENGIYRFRVTDEAGNVTETSVVVDKIDKIAPTLEISGNPVDWTEPGVILQAEASDGIIEYFDGQNWLASSNMTVYENGTYLFRVTDAAGNVTEKSVTVDKIDAIAAPQNLHGTSDNISWESEAARFNFSLTDCSGNILTLMTNGNQLDFYGLLYGEYSAKVKSFNGTAWSKSIDISSNNSHITPQYFKSDADGADDVFFADSYSNWTRGYGASHVGSRDRWNGTGEVVELKGKLRIKNIYEGSSDYGTLVLTDYLCGDAVSADDIFSASPLEIQSVRLSQINEIFAGAGDDIIDMTSQRFEVSGSMKIHGGSGDDVIWANNGENKLFGDGGNDRIVGGIDNDIIAGGAGNDSLHGGGGNDIFVFGSDFGNDTVEQLANGKVTLIFESEKVKWDGAAYTDGKNSVTLNGDFEVEVRYGATPELAAIGAFDNFTTEKIFEDKALIA